MNGADSRVGYCLVVHVWLHGWGTQAVRDVHAVRESKAERGSSAVLPIVSFSCAQQTHQTFIVLLAPSCNCSYTVLQPLFENVLLTSQHTKHQLSPRNPTHVLVHMHRSPSQEGCRRDAFTLNNRENLLSSATTFAQLAFTLCLGQRWAAAQTRPAHIAVA